MRTRSKASRHTAGEGFQFGLNFGPAHSHPPVNPEQFPNNFGGLTAGRQIREDLRSSHDHLIITGFTSLETIVSYLADIEASVYRPRRVRILLGHEPVVRSTIWHSRHQRLQQEVVDYWLEQNISISNCVQVVRAIEALKHGRDNGTIEVRTSAQRKVHAKIYCGDGAVTTGSSNFSESGLQQQIESNTRFTRERDPGKWRWLTGYAEWIWEDGRDFVDGLLDLLQQLLSHVTWQDALARACAEILEGEWAKRSLARLDEEEAVKLWPTQRQGIAQALWIIENQGSVLIADAAGSGKTRMGAHLLKAVVERLWQTGRGRLALPLLTCPKSVQDSWQEELRRCLLEVAIHSHGILSRENSKEAGLLETALRHAQTFAVDEAHNFLDSKSQRTRRLYGGMADLVVLFTATPINKGTHDLLALIDLLGADNFDDETAALLERANWRRQNIEGFSPEERAILKHAIERFMVRRTIPMLNAAIDDDPDAYRDSYGERCRYPTQNAQTYTCDSLPEDEDLAQQICTETGKLRGLIHIGKRIVPMGQVNGVSLRNPEDEVEVRLRMASQLAVYQVMSCLRSSRAALIEHIYGTGKAMEAFGLQNVIKGTETGNYVRKLENMIGWRPENPEALPLPSWLTNCDEYAKACREELQTYRRIADLTLAMSDARENSKASQLAALLKSHRKIVAFDWHVITLSDIRQRLGRLGVKEVYVATGSDHRTRERVRQLFDLEVGAPDVRAIALCSEAMGEAIGLQRASAIVHLDMPSTIRRAEQRIGRVARMNSPHRKIDVLWPKERPNFALRLDQRLVERHEIVEAFIRANLQLPPELTTELGASDLFIHISGEEPDAQWEAMGDAFAPVRGLIEGDDALIPADTYEDIRASRVQVVSSVSVVDARTPWTFLAVAGTEWGAPRWVYLDKTTETPIVDLQSVTERLRANLSEATTNLELDEPAGRQLNDAVEQLQRSEHLLLPRKKQRALEQMRRVLRRYRKDARNDGDAERIFFVDDLLRLLEGTVDDQGVDLRALADCWLSVIAPYWRQRLAQPRRTRPLRIRELDKTLMSKEQSIPTEMLRTAFESTNLTVKPVERRIVAAIVGVVPGR